MNIENNAEDMVMSLDLLREVREMARLKIETSKKIAARRYNSRVVPRSMKAGNLVLRKKTSKEYENKLCPNWERPFRIRKKLGGGGYH